MLSNPKMGCLPARQGYAWGVEKQCLSSFLVWEQCGVQLHAPSNMRVKAGDNPGYAVLLRVCVICSESASSSTVPLSEALPAQTALVSDLHAELQRGPGHFGGHHSSHNSWFCTDI